MIPTQMAAIVVAGRSGPASALQLQLIPTPRPGPREILIRIAAAGVNYADVLQREGRYPVPPGAPETLGMEVAGHVAALGPEAHRWKVGDPVCALLPGGGYAEYASVDERHVLPVPDGLSLIEAAALPETVLTVYSNVFERGGLQPGETLLVHGATSGIGITAIAMAKAAGARVFTTSRGSEKVSQARNSGADLSIDSTNQDFVDIVKEHGGADVILDMVGGAFVKKNLEALNPDGRLCQIAFLTGSNVTLDLGILLKKRLTFTASTLRARSNDEKARLTQAVETNAWPWLQSGQVRIPVSRTFALAEAAASHTYLESGAHVGKVALIV